MGNVCSNAGEEEPSITVQPNGTKKANALQPEMKLGNISSTKSGLIIQEKLPEFNQRLKIQNETQFPSFFQKCVGVVMEQSSKRKREHMIGNVLIAGHGLALTTAEILFEDEESTRTSKRLRLVTSRKEYKVEDSNCYQTVIKKRSDYDSCLNLCLVKITDQDLFSCPLAIPSLIGQFYCATIVKKNKRFEFHLVKISKPIYFQSQNLVQFQCLQHVQNGSPMIANFNNQWFVIGIKGGQIKYKQNFSYGRVFSKALFSVIRDYKCCLPEISKLTLCQLQPNGVQQMKEYLQGNPWAQYDKFLGMSQQQFQQELKKDYQQRMTCDIFEKVETFTINEIQISIGEKKNQKGCFCKIGDLCERYLQKAKMPLTVSTENLNIPKDISLYYFLTEKDRLRTTQRYLKELNDPSLEKTVTQEYLQMIAIKIRRFQLQEQKKRQLRVAIKKGSIVIDEVFYSLAQKQILTFNDVLKDLQEIYFYKMQYYEIWIRDEKEKVKDQSQKIKDLVVDKISIILSNLERSLSEKTVFLVFNRKTLYTQTLKTIANYGYPYKSILSYDESERKLVYQSAKSTLKEESISNYLTLVYIHGNQQNHLDCSEDLLIKKFDSTWIRANDVRLGDQLLGTTDKDRQILKKFVVIKIQSHKSTNFQQFYSISVQNTHTLVANKIVVHNQTQISLNVVQHFGGNQIDMRKEDVFANQSISQKIPNKKVFLGGFQLNVLLRFGDYNLLLFDHLQIFPNQSVEKMKKLNLIQASKYQFQGIQKK